MTRSQQQPQSLPSLSDFGGELRLAAGDLFVGTLVRDGPRHALRSLGYVDTQASSVALDLGHHRLERIEEHWAGAALELTMQLWTRIEMGGEATDARIEQIALNVPRDDWFAVLGVLAGEQIDLVEIRYDLVYAALTTLDSSPTASRESDGAARTA